MAWTLTHLDDAVVAGSSVPETFTSASISPTGNTLLVGIAFGQRTSGAEPVFGSAATTLSGVTLTTIYQPNDPVDTGIDLGWVVVAALMPASPGSGTVSFTWTTAQLVEHGFWVGELTGYRGATAIADLFINKVSNFHEGTNQTSTVVTPAAFENAVANLCLAAMELASSTAGSITTPTNFTNTYHRTGSLHDWNIDYFVGQKTSITWTHNNDNGSGIALEVLGAGLDPGLINNSYTIFAPTLGVGLTMGFINNSYTIFAPATAGAVINLNYLDAGFINNSYQIFQPQSVSTGLTTTPRRRTDDYYQFRGNVSRWDDGPMRRQDGPVERRP